MVCYGVNIVIDDDAPIRGEFEDLDEAMEVYNNAVKDSNTNVGLFEHEIIITLINYTEDKELERYDSVLDRPRNPDVKIP